MDVGKKQACQGIYVGEYSATQTGVPGGPVCALPVEVMMGSTYCTHYSLVDHLFHQPPQQYIGYWR